MSKEHLNISHENQQINENGKVAGRSLIVALSLTVITGISTRNPFLTLSIYGVSFVPSLMALAKDLVESKTK